MKRNSYKKSDKETLQILTKGKILLECITRKIKKKKNGKYNRIWTKEEYDFIVENWGKLSKAEIAKALDRTKTAIICKAARIGLKDYFIYSEEITLNNLHKMLFGRNLDSYTLDIWQRYKMPIKTLKTNDNQEFKVIKITEFIKWLEHNKRVVDLSRSRAFENEPEWMKEKRQADIRASVYGLRNKVWSLEEDNTLKNMVNAQKYGYREISITLKRTEGAIKRRLRDLQIVGRPIKAENHHKWKPEEINLVKVLWHKGYQSCIIAEYLPNRSALAINGLLERYKYFNDPPLKFKKGV